MCVVRPLGELSLQRPVSRLESFNRRKLTRFILDLTRLEDYRDRAPSAAAMLAWRIRTRGALGTQDLLLWNSQGW